MCNRFPVAIFALNAFLLLSTSAKGAQPIEKLKPEVLDRKIEEVIHEPRFAWRMPRLGPNGEELQQPFLVRFFRQLMKMIGPWIDSLSSWLKEVFRSKDERVDSSGAPYRQLLQASLYGLIVLVLGGAAYLFWRSRKTKLNTAQALPVAPAIDLTSPEVSPALMEEDAWLALAREYLDKNDRLLALRAYYLAGLAFLGRKELVHPHAAKSNREYRTELERRSRATPELAPVFSSNVLIFERCWYGGRLVERASIDEFLSNLERMRSLAQ